MYIAQQSVPISKVDHPLPFIIIVDPKILGHLEEGLYFKPSTVRGVNLGRNQQDQFPRRISVSKDERGPRLEAVVRCEQMPLIKVEEILATYQPERLFLLDNQHIEVPAKLRPVPVGHPPGQGRRPRLPHPQPDDSLPANGRQSPLPALVPPGAVGLPERAGSLGCRLWDSRSCQPTDDGQGRQWVFFSQ